MSHPYTYNAIETIAELFGKPEMQGYEVVPLSELETIRSLATSFIVAKAAVKTLPAGPILRRDLLQSGTTGPKNAPRKT